MRIVNVSHNKIHFAKSIITEVLVKRILSTDVDEDNNRLRIRLRGNIFIYIRYNDYEEYSYSISFSYNKLDRIRFDNYDKHWKVESHPHHFHPRFEKIGTNSPMKGDPELDITILLENLTNGNYKDSKFRFGH